MRSQSKGLGSADHSASIRGSIPTIPARLHCASQRRDNVQVYRARASALDVTIELSRAGSGATASSAARHTRALLAVACVQEPRAEAYEYAEAR
jgi:hypothetical protein